jgi:hypothetical protein
MNDSVASLDARPAEDGYIWWGYLFLIKNVI